MKHPVFEIAFQVYALNSGIFKKIDVLPDLWTSMIYKVQFSTTSSLSEKAATCLMDSTCEGFACVWVYMMWVRIWV